MSFNKDRVMQELQRFGGAMYTPVILFAFFGLTVALSIIFSNTGLFGSLAEKGTLWYDFWYVVQQGAWTVFNQMPILFAIAVPIGFAKKEQARCAMEGFVIYMVFNYFIAGILTLHGSYFGVDYSQNAGAGTGLAMIANIKTLDMGMLGAIFIACISAYLHNHFYDTEIPDWLGIFKGPAFVVAVGFLVMLPMALLFCYIWPPIQHGIEQFQFFLKTSGIFGGPAWTWCEERQQYYLHTFAVEQPDLNWENPAVRQALYDAANFWIAKGVGGFRIDAIVYIKKPAVFTDGPVDGADGLSSIHKMIANTPGILDFLHEFRRKVFDGHNIFTVAEANGVTPADLPQWVGKDGAFSMLFEFSHVNLEFPDDEVWCRAEKWPLTKLKKALSDSQQATAANGWYPIFFENHDQIRCVNRYFPEGTDKKKAAKAMATILFSLRGTPFIYEGQELGMANTAFARIEDYNDISTHGQYQLALDEGFAPAEALHLVQAHSRDNARTPMQWTTAAQAGFTTGTPWLPVHDDYLQCCAESEEHDADSVLWYYRRIQAERFQGEAAAILQRGRYEELLADDERIYAFKRILDDQATLTLVNFTNETIDYDASLTEGATVLLGNYDAQKAGRLRPAEAVIYRV
jgi:alpha-glucosidase